MKNVDEQVDELVGETCTEFDGDCLNCNLRRLISLAKVEEKNRCANIVIEYFKHEWSDPDSSITAKQIAQEILKEPNQLRDATKMVLGTELCGLCGHEKEEHTYIGKKCGHKITDSGAVCQCQKFCKEDTKEPNYKENVQAMMKLLSERNETIDILNKKLEFAIGYIEKMKLYPCDSIVVRTAEVALAKINEIENENK